MIKILFICHGNICRSPMAEFVLKDMVAKRHIENEFYIASAATTTEEIGNPVHYGTRNKLMSVGISVKGKMAVQMTRRDYDEYDYLICMDRENMGGIMRILGSDEQGKVYKLLDFSENPRDISDPWYTGDFDRTYEDVVEGCEALLGHLGYGEK